MEVIRNFILLSIFTFTWIPARSEPQRRIAFGYQLKTYQYPYNSQVTLRYNFENGTASRVICGGVFVHPALVLTAASCLTIPGVSFDKIEWWYGGLSKRDSIYRRKSLKLFNHPTFDAALIQLDSNANEVESFFDPRFFSYRKYERTCGTFICGFGSVNTTKDNKIQINYHSSEYMMCLNYTMTVKGKHCPYLDKKNYMDFAECNYAISEAEWVDAYKNDKWVPSTCQGDKGIPIFRTDEDGYIKLKGIVIEQNNCGKAATGPNKFAPDISLQIEVIADWIKDQLLNLFPQQ